jgi:uncharacterized protein YrrD
MQFKQGAEVFSTDGEKVGHIDRVVLDPQTGELTHIVVRKGLLFVEDKVIPAELIGQAEEERVQLTAAVRDLEGLPEFEEQHYIYVDELEQGVDYDLGYVPPFYWYPPFGGTGTVGGSPSYSIPPYVVETERHIPEGTVALREGVNVVSAEGEKVGDIERVLVDPGSDQATHFVISQGLLFKERKLVPIQWVDSVGEDEVRLAVDSKVLERAREFND